MATNITSTDTFIFNRRNSGSASDYYKTTSSQMSEYFRGIYATELDHVIAEIERVEGESGEGDVLLNDRIDAYSDRVKVAVDELFPIVADSFWAYRFDINLTVNFGYDYDACVLGNDKHDPLLEDTSEEACLEKHAYLFYQNLINEPTQQKDQGFYVLSKELPQRIDRVTHFCISNKPLDSNTYPSKGDITWDTMISENDILQVAQTNRTATGAVIVNDEHYGMFKVIKVDTLPYDDGEPFHLLTVEHIGGPAVAFKELSAYQVKVMKSLGNTISTDFVSKSGDIMTGGLVIDAATDNTPRTFYNKGEAHTYDLTLGEVDVNSTIKMLGAGASTISVESAALFISTTNLNTAQLRITDAGISIFKPASYESNVSLTTPTDITHKYYVDTKDSSLEEKINQTNDRIDNISDIVERQKFEMKFATNCWTSINVGNLEQWMSCTSGAIISSELPNVQAVYPKPVFEHKNESTGEVSPLEVSNIDALLISSKSADNSVAIYEVQDGDIIELQLVTDDVNTSPQIIRYIAEAFDINVSPDASESHEVGGETMYLVNLKSENSYLGPNEFIEDAEYIVKQFPRNTGISTDDADARYLLKSGNETKLGTLDIKNDVGDSSVIRFVDNQGESYLEVGSNGDVNHFGSKTIYNSANADSSNQTIEIDYQKINLKSSAALIQANGVDKIIIRPTVTEFGLNYLRKVSTPAEQDTDDTVATLGWIREHLFSRFIAGVGISLSETEDGLVRIAEQGNRLEDLSNVVVPNSLAGGETITYDAEVGRWVLTTPAELLRGSSTLSRSEESAGVGGIWTDGVNFFLRVE